MAGQKTQGLAGIMVATAVKAAGQYLAVHGLQADPDTLAATINSWVKAKAPEALADAKEAMALGMTQVAEATFLATMVQAGIEAAKDAGFSAAQAKAFAAERKSAWAAFEAEFPAGAKS